MLNTNNTGLMIIDVQGRLAEIMHDSSALLEQLKRLIEGAKVLGLPIIWMEQIPEKLGATHPDIAALLNSAAATTAPLAKTTFSGWQNASIASAIKATDCTQWLVAGIEAHVCVYQTLADLLAQGYRAHLVVDAISSRTAANKELAVAKMATMGAELTSVEMALFELQRYAEGPEFKQLIQLIK